jgi:hypothetical protein
VRNVELLKTVAESGVALEQDRPIDCFFWSATEDGAKSLADELRLLGYRDVAMSPPNDRTDLWSVQGQTTISPAAITNPVTVRELVEMAARHSSDFDGWGTEIEEE